MSGRPYISKRKQREPRVAVFCRCGAQWLGAVAIGNAVIDAHAMRPGGNRVGCRLITAAEYEALGLPIKWPQWWTPSERRDAVRYRHPIGMAP